MPDPARRESPRGDLKPFKTVKQKKLPRPSVMALSPPLPGMDGGSGNSGGGGNKERSACA